MSKLTVQLVVWNGAHYLPFLFDALRKQTYIDWDLFVVDNASTDTTVEVIEKELKMLGRPSRLIKNNKNLGFAGGHNQLFKQSSSEYVLLLNQDMYLLSDCFTELVSGIEKLRSAAVVAPRLMRWNFEASQPTDVALGFTNQIDSLGLKVLRNRRVIELSAGEEWPGLKNEKSVEVFGVSGALPLFRRSTLEKIFLPNGTVFDETYISYKEDVDLAFRLRVAGFSAHVITSAVAYHDRTAAHGVDPSDRAALRGKRTQSDVVVFQSYKNHLATLYKNEFWQNVILDFPFILWYEIKKFGYFLLFKPNILRGWFDLWTERKWLKELKMKNQELRKVSWRTIRRWWK